MATVSSKQNPDIPEKKKKRGGYKQKECPYCKVMVGNLPNHIKLKHPAEATQAVQALTKDDILSGHAKENIIHGQKTYACADCHAEIRKGESECWHCGETLVWEGIE